MRVQLMTAEKTKPVDPLYVYEVGSGNEPVILLHGLSKSFKYWEVRIINATIVLCSSFKVQFRSIRTLLKFSTSSRW